MRLLLNRNEPQKQEKNSLSRKVTCCTNEKRQTFKKKNVKLCLPEIWLSGYASVQARQSELYLRVPQGGSREPTAHREASFACHRRAASPPVNKVLQIKGKNVKTPLGWAAHSPLKTLVAQRACSSTVGKMEPRGWMSPMHARVGFSSWGGNMYLYSETLLPSTFTSESSRNGKEKV